MFHRTPCWWRALFVVLFGLATLTWPTAASAATPGFSVLQQGAVATLNAAGQGRIPLELSVNDPTDTTIVLAAYPQVIYRSEVTSLVDGVGPSTAAIATTQFHARDCARGTDVSFELSVFAITGSGASSRCGSQPVHLRLACTLATCDGVYPLEIAVVRGTTRLVEWTMFALHHNTVVEPLQLALLGVIDATAWQHENTSATNLDDVARAATTPLTLAVDYRPLSHAVLTFDARVWRRAFSAALTSPEHRVIAAPPGTVDLAGLAANGLSSEVARQINLTGQILKTLTGRYHDAPIYLEGSTSSAAVSALAHSGFNELVIPDADFTPTPSTTLGWGEPAGVSGATGVSALATDGGLAQIAQDSSIESARRVAMFVDTMAFLHFEAPNAPAIRTVVVPLELGTLSPSFLAGLLRAVGHNPFFTTSSLSDSYSSSLIGTDGSPATRTLNSAATAPWSTLNVTTLRTLLSRTNSYLQAIVSPTQTVALETYSAQAEQVGSPAQRQLALGAATQYLDAQLGSFRIDDSTITLTGSGSELPITLFSTAHYPVTVVLHLITDRLDFPKGSNPQAVTLGTSTKSLRVPTTNRQGGSLVLRAELTTPDGNIVLAHAAIQVRDTGSSVVGYLLSGSSLLVLAWWWLRTFRRRSRGRHGR